MSDSKCMKQYSIERQQARNFKFKRLICHFCIHLNFSEDI